MSFNFSKYDAMDKLFPNPFPDETVYSWISRYFMLAAHADFNEVTLKRLGAKNSRPANEYPPFLARLAYLSGIELHKILFEMTSIHYFQPFMDKPQFLSILQDLSNGKTSSIQSRLGVIASRITPGQFLKYCPQCVQDDTEKYGLPYWHRSHQLVGVTACWRHGKSLFVIKRPSKSAKMPPDTNTCLDCTNVELQLSRLLHSELIDGAADWFKDSSYSAYMSRLKDMALLTATGKIRQRSLKHFLLKEVKLLKNLPNPYPQIVDMLLRGRYPENLFYQRHCNHQPLKHYLLINTLFESWDDFKNEVGKGELQAPSVDVPKDNSSDEDFVWDRAIALISKGQSLTKVAKKFGTTVSTLKLKVIRRGGKVKIRPSKVTPDIEQEIKRRLYMGEKTQCIAAQCNLSVGAIEKVLTQIPDLPNIRKEIWYKERFDHHQVALLSYLEENDNPTRNGFRKGFGKSYIWLYKHEKEWLYRKLPTRVEAIYWPRKPKS